MLGLVAVEIASLVWKTDSVSFLPSAAAFEKQAFFIVLAQIKQVNGVGRLSSLAIKDYILQV